MSNQLPQQPYLRQRWQIFKNTGSIDIPAYSVVEVVGATQEEEGKTIMTCKRVSTETPRIVAVTGPLPIPAGKEGPATFDYPAYVQYSGSTPQNGTKVGPDKDEFEVQSGKPGFVVVGDQTSYNGMSLVYVINIPEVGGGGGGELIWFRIAELPSSDGTHNMLLPGMAAMAYLQEWIPPEDNEDEVNNSGQPIGKYQTNPDFTTDDLTRIFDVNDGTYSVDTDLGYGGQNFVLPGELVPCMLSSNSGRYECVGSRGLVREGKTNIKDPVSPSDNPLQLGIDVDDFGSITIWIDKEETEYTLDNVYWDWLDGTRIRNNREIIIRWHADAAKFKVIDRDC